MTKPRSFDLAVQPAAWATHDPAGCLWASSQGHARQLARAFGERCTVWICPHTGPAYALCWLPG